MRSDKLLGHIKSLLLLLKGVEVVAMTVDDGHLRIEFTISDAYSRLLIFSAAEASNIKLSVWVKGDPCSEESKLRPDDSLAYAFNSPADCDAIDAFCWLGAHLTWRLHECGLMSSNDELKYCKVFGANSRSGA